MKRPLTAKEEQDILDRDPKYQAMMAEKKRRRAELEALFRRDEKPLVEALTAKGWPPNVRQCGETPSVWDLVNTTESYPQLLHTLAEHLTKPYHFRTREGIVRALAVREARGTAIPRLLLNELKERGAPTEASEADYRWALINTLVLIGDSSMVEEARQLMQDERYAGVRSDLQRLAKALARDGRGTDKSQ